MKKILITGGSQGIGSSLVEKLSGQDRLIYFTYNKHKKEALELAKKTGAVPIKCDLLLDEDISNLSKCCGSVDILINNAGVSEIKLFTDITNADWDKVLDVNLKGAFLVTREFLPKMISKKWGRIINISSMWGIIGASCEVQYSASKAGLIGMTKALAKEVGPSNITVNCIAPGLINTTMNANIDSKCLDEMVENTPMQRIGTCDDIANAVEFLIS
ncbi:MAG TPA: SDR family NAD(P)-dependent oxidoreductase, partial [Clostridiales bacterium]|nr:SDR family NAD(P)-dependent oxidoreductase [Clostridiales bacterium]